MVATIWRANSVPAELITCQVSTPVDPGASLIPPDRTPRGFDAEPTYPKVSKRIARFGVGKEFIVGTTTKKRASNGQLVLANPDSYEFATENAPNADVILPSLRSAGYSPETAIGDLVDNPIDKNASTIVVNIARPESNWVFEVGDDGDGMGESVLDEMMRLGSRTVHDVDSDLGLFGLGSDTAALALGRNKHTITIAEGGPMLASMWDLDVVERERKFVKHLGKGTDEEKAIFAGAFASAGVSVPSTGTVVRISKCDRIGRKDPQELVSQVRNYIGRTYRQFLEPNGGLTIVVNGEKVSPIDPMMRSHKETQVLYDEEVEFSWRDEAGETQTDKIGVLIVHLPDFGGLSANKEHGISIDNSGYYVLRNGREIVAGTTFRLFARHNQRSRFRCELSFSGRLDSQVGVTFLKSTAEVKLSQALRDKVKEVTNPYRRQSESLYRKSSPTADEQVPHEEAASQVKRRSAFLRKPETEIEKREPSDGKTKPTEDGRKPDGTRTPREEVQRALANQATFEAKNLGPYAPFYEASLENRRIVVTWNADHPAYQRLILDNRDNRAVIAAMDLLVWSLASAELMNTDDANASLMAKMREDASFNLRQLLSA